MKHFLHLSALMLGYTLVFLGGGVRNGVEESMALFNTLGVPSASITMVSRAALVLGLLLIAELPLSPARLEGWRAPLKRLPTRAVWVLPFLFRVVGVSFMIRWAVGGVAFWAALPILGLLHAASVGETSARGRLEHVLLYLLFFGYGAGGLWNFSGHFFAADMVAASVGWPAGSPFQQELAFYALGTGTVGLLTPWLRDRYWIASALAPSIFVYGAAYTHIMDFFHSGNDAPMNWSFTAVGANLIIPSAVLLVLAAYIRQGGLKGTVAASIATATR
jgi:hypothetical protein